MSHGADGSVLDVGRRTRTIPPALRRALLARDRQCRFPGCTARRCDAHHIEHWIDGGPTSLDNTALLCRTHHRAIHEGGFSLVREPDGTLTFFRPDGARLDPVPRLPILAMDGADPLGPTAARLRRAGIQIGRFTCAPREGYPFDIPWAIDVMRSPARDVDGSPLPQRAPTST
ncbi:MAG TPA: HNH endonuclease signature motif containing protein [Vicinamibacterales bacterium]|nr:HNH endonuclease signature motif containing protein [Vicinamibacterales bacterium]